VEGKTAIAETIETVVPKPLQPILKALGIRSLYDHPNWPN
jgi:hypothetical protein